MNVATPLESIKGVGEKTAEKFADARLFTVGDLLQFLPRTYEDYSEVVNIADIRPGKNTIRAVCEKVDVKRVRRGMTVVTAVLSDKTGKLQAVWFNQPYRAAQLKSNDEFYFSGEFEFRYNKYQLTNPSAERADDVGGVSTGRIVPIYRAIKGLKSQLVRKVLLELKPLITMLPETLPPSIVSEQKLISYSEAMKLLHFPKSAEDVTKARARLAFEELFTLLLGAYLNKQENTKLKSHRITFEQPVVRDFVSILPFTLTGAQRLAAWEILQDFEGEHAMSRMLQGDVGSGKTVVAGLAARQAASAGYQTAIMAPTEILAVQHAETLQKLLSGFGTSVGLLTGSVKGVKRKELLRQIEKGTVDVVVGTHALIQDTVVFHKLGFVAIDEQHRFGVNQRQKLLAKTNNTMPHLLAMTATPIPRSLALTVYGEMDISIINERPKGRKPIQTKIISPISRKSLYAKIDKEIEAGRQAYIICTLIDENTENDAKSVEAEHKKLQNSVFAHRKIGLLHGKMKPGEKDEVMNKFKAGEFDILVSTTVVEVGVDVPNATIMMIEDANKYGLAQLHQLRGRVGRGEHQSYCYLMMSDNSKPSVRLVEIEKSNDGFYLAEVDLRLRGPGEVYGRAQHGQLNLKVATLGDTKMINRASTAAKKFIESGENLLNYKQLWEQVKKSQQMTSLN